MSLEEGQDLGLTSFPSLFAYTQQWKTRFDQLKNDPDPDISSEAQAILEWMKLRFGLICDMRVVAKTPQVAHPAIPNTWAIHISETQSYVSLASHETGLPILRYDTTYRGPEAGIIITKMIQPTMNPLARAKALLGIENVDRLIGEMVAIEKRELF